MEDANYKNYQLIFKLSNKFYIICYLNPLEYHVDNFNVSNLYFQLQIFSNFEGISAIVTMLEKYVLVLCGKLN